MIKIGFCCLVIVLLCALNRVKSEVTFQSPCPNVLTYLPLEAADEGKWTAQIHLSTEDDLKGVWLHVILDRKAHTLLNWFGDSTTADNKEYSIRKADYILEAGPTVLVKIQANYNPVDPPPLVQRIRLNGRTICAENKLLRTTETPEPFVPLNKPTTVTTIRTTSRTTTSRKASTKPTTTTPFREKSTTKFGTVTTSNARNVNGNGAGKVSEFFDGDFSHFTGNSAGSNKPRLGILEEKCGVPIKKATPLITHAQQSLEGAWPWHIAIYTSNVLQLKYICGGSLLTKSHVLTAAHCVTRPFTSSAADADGFLLHLGRSRLSRFGRGIQERQVEKILVHPEYNYTNFRNDVAILVLEKPVEYTDYVRPVCLWSKDSPANITGHLGTVVGWGFDENNNITEHLHESKMPVVDLLTCIYSEPEVYGKLTSTNNFCAGFRNGTSVCNGDSGGGMFFDRTAPDGSVRWEIRGMVSFSVALRNNVCNPRAYAVFTDLLKYDDWIHDNIIR